MVPSQIQFQTLQMKQNDKKIIQTVDKVTVDSLFKI